MIDTRGFLSVKTTGKTCLLIGFLLRSNGDNPKIGADLNVEVIVDGADELQSGGRRREFEPKSRCRGLGPRHVPAKICLFILSKEP